MSLKAILFDAGDTLFRVRGSVGGVYAAAAARHGVTVLAEDIEPRFRTVFRRMRPLAFPGASEAELPAAEYAWWREVVAAVFADSHFADFDAFFADLFQRFAAAQMWELYPDVLPTLVRLRHHGMRAGIVSNFDGRLIGICEGLGIAGFFDTMVMSGRVGAAKPDPRIFAAALSRLGVAPHEALHVGDSMREDVQGAHAAGIHAILVQRGGSGSAASCVCDLRQIIELLSAA